MGQVLLKEKSSDNLHTLKEESSDEFSNSSYIHRKIYL